MNANHVVLSFPHPKNQLDLQKLAHDIRSPAKYIQWIAEVDSVNAGQVTISWEDVPVNYAITLIDTYIGITTSMNGKESYTYWSLQTEVREFIIEVEQISPVVAEPAWNESPVNVSGSFAGGCVTVPHRTPLLPAFAVLIMGILIQRTRIR